MGRKSTRSIAARNQGRGFAAEVADLLHGMAKTIFDPYRPELHYMRGPGPKWHAKHHPAPTAMSQVPVLARVRVKR